LLLTETVTDETPAGAKLEPMFFSATVAVPAVVAVNAVAAVAPTAQSMLPASAQVCPGAFVPGTAA
jgi:hypothetical protein